MRWLQARPVAKKALRRQLTKSMLKPKRGTVCTPQTLLSEKVKNSFSGNSEARSLCATSLLEHLVAPALEL